MNKLNGFSISEPCHENWNRMKASASGKFCGSCAKNVVDFSSKSNSEILDLLKNSDGNVCGRFKKSQVEGLKVQIPQSVFYRKMSFHKAFVLVLFTTMGSMLFSCSDDEGNVQKIESVEVVSQGHDYVMGAVSFVVDYSPDDIHDNITTPSVLSQVKNSSLFEEETVFADTSKIQVDSTADIATDTIAGPKN